MTTNSSSANPNRDLNRIPQRSRTDGLHSRVYALLIGFALWFALAVWSFAGGGLTNYLLFIVSGFILVVVALLLILSRTGRRHVAAERDDNQQSLRDWAASDFETGRAA